MTGKPEESPMQGYGQRPAYPHGPAVAMTPDDRTFGMLGHLLGIFTGFIGPLVIFLAKRKESPFVRDQSAEALNFQITLVIAYLLPWSFPVIGYLTQGPPAWFLVCILLVWAVWLGSLVLMVMASIAAGRGGPYRYPINIRMVRR
ncbi:MAG: DUF4870 domain-containing protein [Streptosporangiales bacterium]|nr:DUF4870 domain-containing protein [Streptosporangiales bacterium]